jgi:DNA-binding CsgD family transcriptional regulator
VSEAAERAGTVLVEAQRHVFPRLAVAAGEVLAGTLQVLGELVEAERVVDEAVELAARAGDVPRGRHRVARVACSVRIEREEPWTALEQLERETQREPNDHQRIAFHGDVALWNARLKGPAAAGTIAENVAAGRENADKVRCPRCAAEILLLAAEAFARIGDRAESQTLLAGWDAQAVHASELAELTRRHVGALAQDDGPGRVAELEAVRDAASASPYQLEALWAQLDLGLGLAEADRKRARGELERAAERAAEIGAGTVEELAGRGLRTLGVRTWRRGAGAGPLTEREAEIARLVAGGASNPEIAQQLFLSRKTVERHVSNVLRKVGARNRAELAGRVAELEIEGLHR